MVENKETISKSKYKKYFDLKLQRLLGHISVVPASVVVLSILFFILKYRIENIKEIRKSFKDFRKNSNTPLIICSNHITIIDSIILIWAFGSIWHYLFNYEDFMWNVPAKELARENVIYRVVAYLAKCMLVDRKGTGKHHKNILDKVLYLLLMREPVLIFPEGTRTRIGRLDLKEVKYGVGSVLQKILPDCNVMTVYLNNSIKHNYDLGPLNYPYRGTRFKIKYNVFKPKTKHTGLRGQKDLSLQIINEIKKLEKEYGI